MKKCTENKFPSVTAGDVVKNSHNNDYYLVCHATRSTLGLMLVNLERGTLWTSDSLWGPSNPEDWEKVNVCFKEIE